MMQEAGFQLQQAPAADVHAAGSQAALPAAVKCKSIEK